MARKVIIELIIKVSLAGLLSTLLFIWVYNLIDPHDLLQALPFLISLSIILIILIICLILSLIKEYKDKERRMHNDICRLKMNLRKQLEIGELKIEIMNEILNSDNKKG